MLGNTSLKQGHIYIKNRNNNSSNINQIENFSNYTSAKTIITERKIEKKHNNPVIQNNINNINNRRSYINLQQIELKQLETRFNELSSKYIDLKFKIEQNALEFINRVSSSNIYLNKLINFSNNKLAYVTSQGIIRPILTNEILQTLKLQKEPINIDVHWDELYNIPGVNIPTTPVMISGEPVVSNEQLGNEGSNVYVSTLINEPSSSYVGCYSNNKTPPIINANIVPVMSSSGEVNGFVASASSIYRNLNNVNAWAVFNNNENNFWHTSNTPETDQYNSINGTYEGTNITSIQTSTGIKNIQGAWIQITIPSGNTVNLSSYILQGRQNCCGTPNGRDPNTWYLCGLKDDKWYEIDYKSEVYFTSLQNRYIIYDNDTSYTAFRLVITKAGNPNATRNRGSIQISKWELFGDSSINNIEAMEKVVNMGYSNVEECETYAINNGYKYFALSNNNNNMGKCRVSNDEISIKQYGEINEQFTAYPLWSSNTSGRSDINKLIINSSGNFLLVDINENVIWQSQNTNNISCTNGGKLNTDTLVATYGGNCGANNNVAQTIVDKYNNNEQPDQFKISINNTFFGDILQKCNNKNWDTSYQCGDEVKTAHITNAEGREFIYDCSAEVSKCIFYLQLTHNGNMNLIQGDINSENKKTIWSSNTTYTNNKTNPQWKSTNSKYGRDYIKIGEGLYKNEWIGNNNGNVKLILQDDGNLVLYGLKSNPGCIKLSNNSNTYIGNENTNAVYKLDEIGDKSNLGKLAYIDDNSRLHSYESDNLHLSDKYSILSNYTISGSDIKSQTLDTIKECETLCNDNNNCNGFVYQTSTKSCWLKDNINNQTDTSYTKGSYSGIRNKTPIKSNNCSNKITNIDSVTYDRYIKGDNIKSNTGCYNSGKINIYKDEFRALQNDFEILSKDINNKQKNMHIKDIEIYTTLSNNTNKILNELNQIKRNKMSGSNIEGMSNMNNGKNNIDGILNQTIKNVNQSYYSYITWTLLAVGGIIILRNIKK